MGGVGEGRGRGGGDEEEKTGENETRVARGRRGGKADEGKVCVLFVYKIPTWYILAFNSICLNSQRKGAHAHENSEKFSISSPCPNVN